VHVRACVCVCVRARACVRVVCVRACVCARACACVRVRVCVRARACTCACACHGMFLCDGVCVCLNLFLLPPASCHQTTQKEPKGTGSPLRNCAGTINNHQCVLRRPKQSVIHVTVKASCERFVLDLCGLVQFVTMISRSQRLLMFEFKIPYKYCHIRKEILKNKSSQVDVTFSTQSNLFLKLICFFYVETHQVSTFIRGGVQFLLHKTFLEQVHSARSSCTADAWPLNGFENGPNLAENIIEYVLLTT